MRRNLILFLGIIIGITILCTQVGASQVNRVKETVKKFNKLACADAQQLCSTCKKIRSADNGFLINSKENSHVGLIEKQSGSFSLLDFQYNADGLVEISAIYFDMDTTEIRPDTAKEIEKVMTVLKKSPQLTIKIRSYTESNGSDDYTMKLSKRRAMATKGDAVKNGKIDPDSISIKAMGRSKSLADCGKHCSDTEHRLNRKSEFVILR